MILCRLRFALTVKVCDRSLHLRRERLGQSVGTHDFQEDEKLTLGETTRVGPAAQLPGLRQVASLGKVLAQMLDFSPIYPVVFGVEPRPLGLKILQLLTGVDLLGSRLLLRWRGRRLLTPGRLSDWRRLVSWRLWLPRGSWWLLFLLLSSRWGLWWRLNMLGMLFLNWLWLVSLSFLLLVTRGWLDRLRVLDWRLLLDRGRRDHWQSNRG